MSDISIDDLPFVNNLTVNDIVPINQNLETKKARFGDIKNLVWGDVLLQAQQVAEGAIQNLQDQINMITENDLGNLSDLLEQKSPRIVGQPIPVARVLTPLEYIKYRVLPLEYGVYAIEDYPDLIEKMYCGNENNATAYFWYKCRNDANKTRDINGTHFRAADWRGIFWRGAGANAVLLTDMNNPLSPRYDGGNVGSIHYDSTRKFSIWFGANNGPADSAIFTMADAGWGGAGLRVVHGRGDSIDCILAYPLGNFGNETSPVWGAATIVISY